MPIVIDTDMGLDDLLAIYVLLREPAVDVRAITVDGTGLVHCGAGVRNLRRILGVFDRLDIPFGCGREEPGPNGRAFPEPWRDQADAMYGVVLPPVVATEFPPDATAILRQALAAAAEPVTVLAIGTWTNLQDLFAADPAALDLVAGIHAMAGAVDVPGNVDLGETRPDDRVEWNVGADPDAFAAVMALDVPITLVPLDATDDVPVPDDVFARLEADHGAAGADIAYETYARNPYLYGPGQFWWDPTAAVAMVEPGLVEWQETRVRVALGGSEAGRITRDSGGRPVRVAMVADTARVQDAILAGLRRGGPRPEPFAPAGTLSVTWDGATCTIDEQPTTAGLVRVALDNRSAAPVGLFGAGVREPRTWGEALAYLDELDLSDQEPVVPDWIVPLEGEGPYAQPGTESVALVPMPAGTVGLACATGQWPDLSFADGGSFTLAD